MRLFFALLVCGSSLQPAYGSATLKGHLVCNRIGGAPVAGAAVAAESASPTASTTLGAFTLEFPNKKPGDRVKLTVSAAGMTVVNWVQLEVVLPADAGGMNVLTLLLAREADREEMAAEFFRLRSSARSSSSTSSGSRRRGRTKGEAVARVGAGQGTGEPDSAGVGEGTTGTVIALVRRGDAAGREGKVDEALKTLDEAKLRARAQEAKETKEAADKQLRETARDWALRGSLLATQFRFAEAEGAYRSAIETAPDDFDRRFEFAVFSRN